MFDDIEQLEKEVQEFRQNMLGSTALLKSLDAIVLALKAQTTEFTTKSNEMTGKLDAQATAIQNKADDTLEKLVTNLTNCIADIRKVSNEATDRLSAENKANLVNTTTQIQSTQQGYIEALQATEKALQGCKTEFSIKSAEMTGGIKAQSEAMQKSNGELLEKLRTCVTQCIAELKKVNDDAVSRLAEENKNNLANSVAQFSATQKEYIAALEATDRAVQAYTIELNKKHGEFLERLEKTNIDQIYQGCMDMKKSMESKFTILLTGVGVAIVLAVVGLFI